MIDAQPSEGQGESESKPIKKKSKKNSSKKEEESMICLSFSSKIEIDANQAQPIATQENTENKDVKPDNAVAEQNKEGEYDRFLEGKANNVLDPLKISQRKRRRLLPNLLQLQMKLRM